MLFRSRNLFVNPKSLCQLVQLCCRWAGPDQEQARIHGFHGANQDIEAFVGNKAAHSKDGRRRICLRRAGGCGIGMGQVDAQGNHSAFVPVWSEFFGGLQIPSRGDDDGGGALHAFRYEGVGKLAKCSSSERVRVMSDDEPVRQAIGYDGECAPRIGRVKMHEVGIAATYGPGKCGRKRHRGNGSVAADSEDGRPVAEFAFRTPGIVRDGDGHVELAGVAGYKLLDVTFYAAHVGRIVFAYMEHGSPDSNHPLSSAAPHPAGPTKSHFTHQRVRAVQEKQARGRTEEPNGALQNSESWRYGEGGSGSVTAFLLPDLQIS